MANSWLRLWHDMPNDPKWRTIARRSGQSIGNVMAVYLHILVNASSVNETKDANGVTRGNAGVTHGNANKRGVLKNFCADDVASSLDLEPEQVELIISAMQGKVLDGDTVLGWNKRQPKREDDSTLRVKACRERKRAEKETTEDVLRENVTRGNAGVTHGNAPDKDSDTEKDKDLNTLVHGEKNASEPDEDFPAPDDPEKPGPDSAPGETRTPSAGRQVYPEDFEQVWREYPARAGSNPKNSAFKAWKARRREGVSAESMLDGVRRYAAFLGSTRKTGTEFVQRGSTFFGTDRNYENSWDIPVRTATGGRDINQIQTPDSTIPPGFTGAR